MSKASRPQALTAAQVEQLAANADKRVIVIMRNQAAGFNPGLAHIDARNALTADAEQSVFSELRQLHAPNLHAYHLISAVSATVSAAERQRLEANPAVRAVVPDRVVRMAPTSADGMSTGPAAASHPAPGKAAKVNKVPGTCPTKGQKPLLPEYLSVMHATQAQKLATGKGVKVAVFPDGLDPNIPDFMRGGHSVIFDYRDFTGEGPKGVTGGEEAFGDASSIAAQGTHTYDLSGEVSPHFPLPKNCDIRVKGVAPGASLAVMKVFGDVNSAFNSEILQGMDWAVTHDHVDVLSESFGGNPLPNTGADDPIALFDARAVKNGISVVASTGDAGTTSTIGSPATNKGVIAAAGTTTYQIYAQTSTYGAQLGDKNGWEHNNIAPISSSGFNENADTATVAAPADGNWADCSTDTATFTECADLWTGAKNPQPIVPFGGTSESCPLTAGTVALIIQAYRDTHGGKTPSPALVKSILTSTATDIHASGEDQGAGLVNALRAVELARSIGKSKRLGSSLLVSNAQVSKVSRANKAFSFREKVTNEGAKTTTVAPKLTQFSAPKAIKTGTLTIKNSDKKFFYLAQAGTTASSNYLVPFTGTTIKVPHGVKRLITRIAWNGAKNVGIVRANLFDPQGKIVANSRPQGANGGFGEIQDNSPTAGTYRLVVFPTTMPFFTGAVHYAVYGEKDLSVGKVTPKSAKLKPGKSATLTIDTRTPKSPGDVAQTLRFGNQAGTVPVIERSLLHPTVKKAAKFSTTVTGGNARPSLYGLANFYQFNVPKGVKDIDADVALAHSGYLMFGLLVDPNDVPQVVQSSANVIGGNEVFTRKEHMTWANPTPGRWTLITAIAQGQTSALTSVKETGSVAFNDVKATQTGLPNGATLTPAQKKTAKIHITNNGNSTEAFFVDPRLTHNATIVPFNNGTTSGDLPIAAGADIPQFLVPPFSNKATIAAKSGPPSGGGTAPDVDFDTSPGFGTPDVLSTTGTTAVATLALSDLPSSEYSCTPTIVAPGGFATPTDGGTYSCSAAVVTKAFDPNVASSTGDLWANGSATPLVLKPGQSGTIKVTITAPNSHVTVSGFVPIVTFNQVTDGGDFYKSFPYKYKVSS